MKLLLGPLLDNVTFALVILRILCLNNVYYNEFMLLLLLFCRVCRRMH